MSRDCPRLPEMSPHARDQPRSAEITEIRRAKLGTSPARDHPRLDPHAPPTHHPHRSCPRVPRRRPPPTPLERWAAQRRSCLSLWGGRRCAAPPSYTRDSTVKGPGARGGPGVRALPESGSWQKISCHYLWVRSLPRDANLDDCAEKSRCRPNRRTLTVSYTNKAALCPALVNATREV